MRGKAIVAGETLECELQHDFSGANRPRPFPFDVFEPLEKAANVKQQSGEFGFDRVERLMDALARRDHGICRRTGNGSARPAR